MTETRETAVLIVGGGPVGLTLAMDLASRGVEVILVEARGRGEAPPPKCNHTSARSMEIFRRLGVGALLRDAGLPPDYPNDCVYRTTMLNRTRPDSDPEPKRTLHRQERSRRGMANTGTAAPDQSNLSRTYPVRLRGGDAECADIESDRHRGFHAG